jgi:hypothetical protein
MTAREIKIAKKILDQLHTLDGGQAHAFTIHAEIGGLAAASASEFEEVLAELDQRKYALGVHDEFKGTLWSITSLGESARRKMG